MPEALMGAEARPTKDAVIAQSHGMHYTPVPTLPMDTQARREKTSYADDDSTSPMRIVPCRERCGGEASVVNHAVIVKLQGMHPWLMRYTPVSTLPMDTQARFEKTSYADDDSTSPIRIVPCRDRCGGKAPVVNHAVIVKLQGMYPSSQDSSRTASPSDEWAFPSAVCQPVIAKGSSPGPRVQDPRMAPPTDALLVSAARWPSRVDDGSRHDPSQDSSATQTWALHVLMSVGL